MTSDDLGRAWLESNRKASVRRWRFGRLETFWAYIPHSIHSPFYVYAYAFGDCLVISLLLCLLKQPTRASGERYFRHAQGRRNQAPHGTPGAFRTDASDPGFWNQGLSMIEGLIDELEAMDT